MCKYMYAYMFLYVMVFDFILRYIYIKEYDYWQFVLFNCQVRNTVLWNKIKFLSVPISCLMIVPWDFFVFFLFFITYSLSLEKCSKRCWGFASVSLSRCPCYNNNSIVSITTGLYLFVLLCIVVFKMQVAGRNSCYYTIVNFLVLWEKEWWTDEYSTHEDNEVVISAGTAAEPITLSCRPLQNRTVKGSS